MAITLDHSFCLQNLKDGALKRMGAVISAALCALVCLTTTVKTNSDEDHYAQYETWITNHLGNILIKALHLDRFDNFWVGTEDNLFILRGPSSVDRRQLDPRVRTALSRGVTDIAEDEYGNVFVSTFGNGIIEFNPSSGHLSQKRQIAQVDVSHTQRIFAFSNGLLWLVTRDGVHIVKSYHQELLLDESAERVREIVGLVHSVDRISDGRFVVGGENAIVSIDLNTKGLTTNVLSNDIENSQAKITSSLMFSDQKVFFGTSTGRLGWYDIENGEITSPSEAQLVGNPRILEIKNYGKNLAISTDYGVVIYNEELTRTREIVSGNHFSSSTYISTLLVDDINLWIGTLSGVQLIRAPAFRLYTSVDGLESDDVLHIEEDDSGGIWLGTFNGLYYYDSINRTHTRVDQNASWPETYPKRISALEFSERQLLVGFIQGHGILRIDLDSLKAQPLATFDKQYLNVLELKMHESELWIGTHGQGLIRHSQASTTRYLDSKIFPYSSVNEIVPLQDGRIALATIDRAFILEENRHGYIEISLETRSDLPTPDILDIFEDKAGNVWIGTAGDGLYLAGRESLASGTPTAEKYRFDSSLDFDHITNICSVESGEFWISAGNRVASFFPFDKELKFFDSNDGLPKTNISIGSALCSTTGALFYGSGKGYSHSARTPSFRKERFRISLVDLQIDGKSVVSSFPSPAPNRISIAAHELPLEINLAVSDYLDPNYVEYRYRVSSQKNDWVYHKGSNQLRLDHLSLGLQSIYIQAANSQGVWSDEQLTLQIFVHRSPWNTWWAYALYSLAIAFSFWGAHRIYYSYIAERRSQELTIEIEETRNRAEDEIQEQLEFHDELARAAHQHHGSILKLLQRCLNETLSGSENAPSPESVQASPNYLQALSLLEDCTIYDEGEVSINLRVFVEKLFPAIMPYCRVDPATIITVNEVKADPITLEIGTTLGVIIYELARNAITHAYPQSSPANYLRVISRVEYDKETDSESLVIIVRDSGEGIPDDAIETAAPGSGIALVQSLAANIGAEFSYSYSKGTMAKITLKDSQSNPIFA